MVAQFSHAPNNLLTFDIRNFLDTLTPAKEKNKFICPACEGHNLSIDMNTGEYQCWNGCECRDIREAIKPWDQVLEERNQGNYTPRFTKQIKLKPVPIPTENINIGTLPNPTSPETIKAGGNIITKFPYSPTQWVQRTDKPDGTKATLPYHINNEGETVNSKGEQAWLPYRFDEIIQHGASHWILGLEGEKCTDVARANYQILSFTFQGGSWGESALTDGLQTIKNAGVAGVIYWPDHDDTGYNKAKKCSEIAAKIGLPFIEINPLKIWSGCPQKGDIADFAINNNMDGENLVKLLQQQIKEAATNKPGLTIDPVSQDLDEKLRLDLLALLQESDPIKKVRRRAEICSYFRLSKSEVDDLLKYINRRTVSQETKVYTLDELFDLESEGLTWVIPELLPKGETIILAGSPKAGKSLLAIDAAFAIATGESHFLGETVQRGKVLLISCDESLQSTKSKLIKRGFRRSDSQFIRILPQWTIDDKNRLEQELEDFRPDVVIVDSLKRITHGSQISENSAEFADNIYSLKELFNKYSASGILIHHANKNNESTGVNKLRGSSAIAGAVWGTWQIEHILRPDPNNKKKLVIDPKDPVRVLSVFARDTEGQTLKIEFNPENNSWEKLAVEEDSTEASYRERILNVLRKNSHCDGLSGKEVMHLLGEDGNKSIYSELNRMVNKRLISCKPANNDKRINLYSLPISQQPQNIGGDSPSPIPIDPIANYYPQTLTQHSFDNSQQNSQQLVSNSQQLPEKTNLLTNENPCSVGILSDSQQVMENEGGEGVSPVCTEVVNIADNVISAEVQEPIKVGDKVLVPHPQANDQGDTVREVGEGWLMVDWIPVKFPLDEVTRL
jgi:KaiC/GvpD/RAD55 family RecA-like ATPase